MKNQYKWPLLAMFVLSLSGCSEPESSSENLSMDGAKLERWYTSEQVKAGKPLFSQNCAVCHGTKAQGISLPWDKPLADGSLPPPPLNGTAHAWHHPLRALFFTISKGGKPVGGKMPAFAEQLTLEQQATIIAYFQHYWSDPIYQAWLNRGGLQ